MTMIVKLGLLEADEDGIVVKKMEIPNYGAIHFIFDNVSSNSHLIDYAPSCASFHSFMHAAICAFYRLSTPFHQ